MPPLPRLLAYLALGLVAGFLSGLFGVGGGILIVPALVILLGFEQKRATGTSLLAVGVFGLATAMNYAASGLVDWLVAAQFIAGGIAGGWAGLPHEERKSATGSVANEARAQR